MGNRSIGFGGPGRRWSILLAAFLVLLGVRTAFLDREDWPGFIGDEATYLLAAESLAWDLDFYYERADYDRFVEHWGERPEMLLFLQSDDHGRTLAYGKPLFFPLAAAPLTRIWPTHGALLTNLLFLAVAAALVARALERHLGALAPLWVAVFLFASVAFAYSVWAHADSFLMSLTASALSLALLDRRADADRGSKRGRKQQALWLAIGMLFAIVAFSRPFYATLALPLLALLPTGKRARLGIAFGAGALLIVGAAAAVHWQLAGAVTSYTGERGGFYARVGLPEVDFPGESWDEAIHRTGNFAWYQAREPLEQETRLGLWSWNSLYLVAGEHVGLVPYFLPIVLALCCLRMDRVRLALLLAVVLAVAAFFFYRPFNFYGGGAAIGNRYFLPLYPAVWFLVARRPRDSILAWGPLVVALAAAPFLWPLWAGLGSYPLSSEQSYRFVSPAARALLPYETTQSHLKPGGQEDVLHRNFWIRVLSPGARVDAERIWVRSNEWAELLLAFNGPRETLALVGPESGRATLELATGKILDSEPGEGITTYRLRLPDERARHPMWWTWESLSLYRLRFRLAGAPPDEVIGLYLEGGQPR
ncbi:MAG: hypothetical protein ACE5GX_06705 [Thermoanaerobaculia bacterium]